MQPVTIYKLGTKLKIELHYEPTPCFRLCVNEGIPTDLELGEWFDLVRFLGMFAAKQKKVLGSLSGKPVAFTGKKILERLYTDSSEVTDQLDFFKDDSLTQ